MPVHNPSPRRISAARNRHRPALPALPAPGA